MRRRHTSYPKLKLLTLLPTLPRPSDLQYAMLYSSLLRLLNIQFQGEKSSAFSLALANRPMIILRDDLAPSGTVSELPMARGNHFIPIPPIFPRTVLSPGLSQVLYSLQLHACAQLRVAGEAKGAVYHYPPYCALSRLRAGRQTGRHVLSPDPPAFDVVRVSLRLLGPVLEAPS